MTKVISWYERPENSKFTPLVIVGKSESSGEHACYARKILCIWMVCDQGCSYGLERSDKNRASACAPEMLRIFAIEKVAHGFSSGGVLFATLGFIPATTGWIGRFTAAFRTMVHKTRLARLQLEFFRADRTYFDGKFHNVPSILSEISFHTHQSAASARERA
jgi:hypothetical protein